jgi:two-component sensor histidine kinase/CheY-like chemotaxis protein
MDHLEPFSPGESDQAWRIYGFDRARTRAPPLNRSGAKPRPTSRSRILIADANADLRLYLGSLIGREHDVTVVNDGEEALCAICVQHPDLVIADVTIPGLGGYELVSRLRAEPSTASIPIILLSARVDEDARIEGLVYGADDYIVKPFSVRELRARINTHLALSNARRAVERLLRQSNRELERKVEERSAALRESEERNAYLLTLSDALRPLRDAGAIQEEATRLLRDKLDAGWCYYTEFESTGTVITAVRGSTRRGQAVLVERGARLPAEHLGELRAGRAIVVSDVFGAETLHGPTINFYIAAGARAVLAVPLVKARVLIAALIAADSMVRPWTQTALNLIGETAERTWAAVERARAEAHQSVLLAELQHRVRNMMALIRSVTVRTGQRARTVAEYSELLSGRLLTLSRVQTLLTRAADSWVNIADIVRDEVSGHEDQYRITGPDVRISPKATEVVMLVLHELVTNAIKHGALSVPSGRVEVKWWRFERAGIGWLGLDWIESNGPALPQDAPGRHRGFGSELIEELIPYELGGIGRLTLAPGGARCRLELPLKEGASLLKTDPPPPSIA